MGKLSVVVGGAFGSEAKGAVTAEVCRDSLRGFPDARVTAVRTAGHNAGHTAYDDQGRAWALRTIPVAAVCPDVDLFIAAGSEVHTEVFQSEVRMLEDAGISIRDRLYVDPMATWLTDHHIAEETGRRMHELSGSTGKGVGAARASRIMRTAEVIGDWPDLEKWCSITDTGRELRARTAASSEHVILEGTQGYGLGLHTPFYPLTTSSDCRAIDFLSMAGIDPTAAHAYDVWVVMRPFPIRVAGPSGPLKGETTWEELGLPEERTTVTKKVRRVGHWDAELAADAVEANGGLGRVKIALTMADQVVPGIRDVRWREDGPHPENTIDPEVWGRVEALINDVETDAGADVCLLGTGPNAMVWL